MMGNSKKHRSYVTCSCGQVLYSTIKARHVSSTRHRYGKYIIEALESGLSLKDVGDALGITRERVRQVAKVLGVTPASVRMAERGEQKALTAFFNRLSNSRLGRFLEAARKQGFTNNQLVPLPTARYAGEYYHDRVWIGGKLVIVKASHNNRQGKEDLISIHNTSADVDYAAYELYDGRWLFLKPWGSLAEREFRRATMFTVKEVPYGGKGYTYSKSHHFRDGIEAWHYFTDGDK